MENCLVTKLKGIVDNDNLEELGVIKIEVGNTNNNFVTGFSYLNSYSNQKKIDAEISSGSFSDSETVTKISNGAGQTWVSVKTTEDAIIRISPKYNLASLGIRKYNYNSQSNDIVVPATYAIKQDFVFDITKLKYCDHLTKFVGLCDCSGNIVEAFGHLSTLNTLRLYCGNLTGDLKDLVAKFVDNSGNNSGSIPTLGLLKKNSPLYSNGNIKISLNGTLIQATSNEEGTLVWESKDKIYIQSFGLVNCTGYTDKEIATNTASGGIWEGCQVIKK